MKPALSQFTLTVIVSVILTVVFTLVSIRQQERYDLDVRALQAQVDKKYCKKEKTIPELKKELLKDGR